MKGRTSFDDGWYGDDEGEPLDGYWHCSCCEWEGSRPGITTYRHEGVIYIDEMFCPKCPDYGDLVEGERPDIDEETHDVDG